MREAWIATDLDGTLALYDGWISDTHIGEPIKPMVDRVKSWLAEGKKVKIFTARVSQDDNLHIIKAIEAWCLKHIGEELEVTCVKDFDCLEIWDDRAIQVIQNEGIPVGYSTRGN